MRVSSLPKRLFFHALFLSISVVFGLHGGELMLRLRSENGLRGTLNSFSGHAAPTSTDRDDLPLIADPVLGFRYNPALGEVSSIGLRNPEIELANPAGKKRVVILGDSGRLLVTEEARRAYVDQGDGFLSGLSHHSYLALRLRSAWMALRKSDEKYPWDRYPGFPKSWQDEPWEFVAEQLAAIREMRSRPVRGSWSCASRLDRSTKSRCLAKNANT